MTTVNYYEKRRNYQDCLDQLYSLRRDTAEPGWDMGDAQAIPGEAFANAILLVHKILFEIAPIIQVSTKGNLGLFFSSEIFRGIETKVVTVGVIFRGDEIRVGTLFEDETAANTGFRPCGIDEIKKTADYINGIGKNGQDRI